MNHIKTIQYSTLTLVLYLSIATSCNALTINEIYPAPANDESEWVEVYNETDSSIALDNFSLFDEKNHQITFESTSVGPKEFILAISKDVLNNGGDTVSLKNANGETIDGTTYNGSYDDKKSWARCPDGSGGWTVTTTITKKSSNGAICTGQSPTSPENNNTQSPSPTTVNSLPSSPITPNTILTDYNNIVISEAMVYPQSASSEWVELFNGNNYEVSLNNWYIDDNADSGSSPKQFSLTIKANDLGVVEITSSMFNNDGDIVRLLNSDKSLKDSFVYAAGSQGKSFGRITLPGGSICLQEPSSGSANKACIIQEITTTSKATITTASQTSNRQNNTQTVATTALKNTASNNKTTQKNSEKNITTRLITNNTAENNNGLSTAETGSVLGTSNDNRADDNTVKTVKALAAGSFSTALLNIIYIINKMMQGLRASA